jgi:hypothetical protein
MTTNAQIRPKTVVNRSRRAEPRPQEAISAPRDRTHDRSDPEKNLPDPLAFHRSPRARPAASPVRVFSCVASECTLVRAIRLRGAKVGVIVDRHGVDTLSSTLTVRDLAGAHVLHTVHPNSAIGYGDSLITYVLAPSGNVAWATETTSPKFGRHGTIHRAIGHSLSTLDKGPKARELIAAAGRHDRMDRRWQTAEVVSALVETTSSGAVGMRRCRAESG